MFVGQPSSASVVFRTRLGELMALRLELDPAIREVAGAIGMLKRLQPHKSRRESGAQTARVGLSSTILLSRPLTNDGDSSVDRSLAKLTASLTATASGTSST